MSTLKHLFLPCSALLASAALLTGCGVGTSRLADSASSLSNVSSKVSTTPSTAAATPTGSDTSLTAARGSAQFTIQWPQNALPSGRATLDSSGRTRLIPAVAQSLTVVVLDSPSLAVLKQAVVPRPADGQTNSIVTLGDLPPRALLVAAGAYASADGTGTALSSGSGTITIRPRRTTSLDLELNSTIAALAITPNPITLYVGLSAPITVSAVDAKGAMVLLPTSGATITYQLGSTNFAAVSGAGNAATLTGVAVGQTTLTVTDTESGKTATSPINVLPDAGNIIVPIK